MLTKAGLRIISYYVVRRTNVFRQTQTKIHLIQIIKELPLSKILIPEASYVAKENTRYETTRHSSNKTNVFIQEQTKIHLIQTITELLPNKISTPNASLLWKENTRHGNTSNEIDLPIQKLTQCS